MNDVEKAISNNRITDVKWEYKEDTTVGVGSLSWTENGVKRKVSMNDVLIISAIRKFLEGTLNSNGERSTF